MSKPRTRPLMLAALVTVALAGCSKTSAPPEMSDDLKADLQKAGGGIQMVGTPTNRITTVSAAEQTPTAAPARVPVARPHASLVARRPVHTPRPQVTEPAPAIARAPDPAPEVYTPRPQPRPQAPVQAPTQREPVGGWKTEAQVFKNAPFPINP